jgi:glycosyltransferase involved in cell wall biosynthesis
MGERDRQPLVSIITPAYNRQSLIEETILSVIGQDYPNVEYLVLDDGSSDGTLSVIKKYENRLKYENHPNIGETRTVNRGFKLVQGDIVGVVNSDDPLLPGAVHAAVELMMRRPEVVVAYPDWEMIDSQGDVIQHVETYEYDYLDMLRWHHCLPGPGTFFRKSVIEKIGGRDEQFRYVADFDFWLRAGLLGPFARIPQTLATFRWHEGGASSNSQGIAMAREHIMLAQKVLSADTLSGEMRHVRKEALSSAYYVAGVVLGDSSAGLKKIFFAKALVLSPRKYLGEYRNRIGTIAAAFLGRRACSLVSRLRHLSAVSP